ncbi:hypothetical protein [Nocardioides sp. GY 10127]|uniref:hypothetical protein n=1 Tax=Nocardioides sp. GY 10127 TaxID=2569762 RepID=UPI001457F8DB|nr:hypothetical protein [Nocardioides sp. GY 10127]
MTPTPAPPAPPAPAVPEPASRLEPLPSAPAAATTTIPAQPATQPATQPGTQPGRPSPEVIGEDAPAAPALDALDAPDAPDAPDAADQPTTDAGTGTASWWRRVSDSRLPFAGFLALVAASVVALVAGVVPIGPDWLPTAGSVVLTTAYAWALAARTGGRPVVLGTVVAVLGTVVALSGEQLLADGAAVLTAVVSALLGVMATVPARGFGGAAREAVLALAIATIGSLGVVGWGPSLEVVRFDYLVLFLSTVGALLLVHGLAAGLHGLGRRGLVTVAVAGLMLIVGTAYAEALRRYGPGTVVSDLLSVVRWTRLHLGAFPRPLMTLLGVPAIVWGVHMRARRRQGWWMCAFGVAATAPVSAALVHARVSFSEAGLSTLYGLLLGLLIGFLVIRLDLAVTGQRGRGSRRAERAAAARPEPGRTQVLR